MTPFTPDGAVSDLVIGHASAVLPDVVIEDARLVVRGGRIAHVGPHPPGASCDLDVRGAYLLPGLIDVHSDMLSREMRPRPGVVLDPSLAIASAGARLRAAGTTTVLHGLAFQERSIVGTAIDSPAASELSEALACTDDRQVDHQVLHRLDVRCEYGRELLEKELEPRAELLSRPADRSGSPAPEGRGAGVPVVSYEDHTPGQGQFADPMTMQRWLVLNEGMSQDDAADHVEWWRSSREKRQGVRDRVLAWLESLARKGLIRLFGHDLATRDDVEAAAALGCSVAEFPTTLEAARAARDQGMLVIAGARTSFGVGPTREMFLRLSLYLLAWWMARERLHSNVAAAGCGAAGEPENRDTPRSRASRHLGTGRVRRSRRPRHPHRGNGRRPGTRRFQQDVALGDHDESRHCC